MSQHRAVAVRPRWGRVGVAALAALITVTTLVGGAVVGDEPTSTTARDTAPSDGPTPTPPADVATPTPTPAPTEAAATAVPAPAPAPDDALPAGSGQGRRVVFSEGRQRVWLVGQGGDVARTYLVSGSVYDNLDPGSYEVYSRSEDAVGVDDSGTMQWFVRFTQGDNAAIGFHDIPVDDGRKVQTVAQLGTPLSHGCIRQRRRDARALWDFAPIGTSVVVTA